MSFTPWKEAAFLSNSMKVSAPSLTFNKPSSSALSDVSKKLNMKSSSRTAIEENPKILSVEKNNKGSQIVMESFDKRFILRTMQKQCSVDFLRKNNLAGSEELILKKRNKESILLAYTEWMQGSVVKNQMSANVSEGDFDGNTMDHISIDETGNNSDACGQRLIDVFSVLYSRSNHVRTTVLLLHEDYSNELAVFGQNQEKKTSTHDSTSAPNISSDEPSGEVDLGSSRFRAAGSSVFDTARSEKHQIICVMGAVRDASDSEISAAITGECCAMLCSAALCCTVM